MSLIRLPCLCMEKSCKSIKIKMAINVHFNYYEIEYGILFSHMLSFIVWCWGTPFPDNISLNTYGSIKCDRVYSMHWIFHITWPNYEPIFVNSTEKFMTDTVHSIHRLEFFFWTTCAIIISIKNKVNLKNEFFFSLNLFSSKCIDVTRAK